MRARLSMLLAVLLAAVAATATAYPHPVITKISPERFSVNSGGQTIRIDLTNFSGPAGASVVFDGPAGHFVRQPSSGGTAFLEVAVPQEIIGTIGRYTLFVVSSSGQSGTEWFEVLNNGRTVFLQVPGPIVVEATGANGASVTFSATATGDGTVTCSHSSGSVFPLGTTTVQCTATDSGGDSETKSFTITVRDTTPPRLTLPADITATSTGDGAVVAFQAAATDLVDGNVAVHCAPPAGSKFPVGQTLVSCQAVDAHANAAHGTFKITVLQDAKPPRLVLPPDQTAEATGPNGAVVQFTVAAYPGRDDHNGRPLNSVTCTPPSGSTFPLGTTSVSCTAHDPENGTSSTGSFNVTVVDTRPPVLNLPRQITARTNDPNGTTVNWTASATDAVDGSFAVTCTPASGSHFSVGTTNVSCTASDSRGNGAAGGFDVIVIFEEDSVLELPGDMTVEATGPGGAVVTFPTSVFGDDENGRPISQVTCAPPSGSLFALGETTVNCSATVDGQHLTGSFKITVVDTTAPALALPPDMSVSATSSAGAEVSYSASANDLVDGPVAVTCAPASGSTFPIGATTVLCTASDARGNSANGAFNVIVTQTGDTTAPVFTSISASPDTLQPANHKLVPVTITAAVTDDTDPAPLVRVFDVTANEPVDAPGSGNTTDYDWRITGALTLELRAERSGQGQERIYTVHVEAIDAAGNRSVTTVTVKVPRDGSNDAAPVNPGSSTRRRSTRR